jgi:hypothetical protein
VNNWRRYGAYLPIPYLKHLSEMLLTDRHALHINPICEPPFLLGNFDVIDARHTLAHFAFFFAVNLESPVLEAVRSVPLSMFIVILVEELNSLDCKYGFQPTRFLFG